MEKQSKLSGDYVVILHGVARTKTHMRKVTSCLKNAGFDVIAITYPSRRYEIAELAEFVQNKITQRAVEDKKIHFVGYSLGALITRALLHKYSYENLGRVVHLAPPNQGSEIADFVKDWRLYKFLFGPVSQQFITDQSAIKHLFGEVNYELGIIAGDLSIDPFSSMVIKGRNDGKISIERTKLPGMKDHITLCAAHAFFPFIKKVQIQTLYFLENGEFQR